MLGRQRTQQPRPNHGGDFTRFHGERFDIDDQRAVDDFFVSL
jgi:hypothetical protein